jgi:hypothetical protein
MGIMNAVAGLVRAVPGGELPARVIEQSARLLAAVEAATLRVVADRLLSAAGPGALALSEAPTRKTAALPSAQVLMEDLLGRALQSNTDSGHQDFYVSVLRQLVPDEARILAALATGPNSPLVSVYRRGNGEPVLENACLIGRTAAVTIPSRTPSYVSHLLRLGVVELGPEDQKAGRDYELLLADRAVREALSEGELGKVPAKVVRRTLRLTSTGRDLWSAAQQEERP